MSPAAAGLLPPVGPLARRAVRLGRRVRSYLSGAGLSTPRPPGDPLPAAEMRGVSAAGGEARRSGGPALGVPGRGGAAGRGGGREEGC